MKIFIKINAILFICIGALVLIMMLLDFQHFKENYLFYFTGIAFGFSFGVLSLMYLHGYKNLGITLKFFAIIFLISSISGLFGLISAKTTSDLISGSFSAIYQAAVAFVLFSYVKKHGKTNDLKK